jgi:arylsulfatase A-like enzyme
MQRKISFWIKLILFLNVVTVCGQYHNGILPLKSGFGGEFWASYTLGFLLQAPIIVILSVAHYFLSWISRPIQFKSFSFLSFGITYLLVYLVFFVYIGSTILSFQVAVYPSVDTMNIFFTDMRQVLPSIIKSNAFEILSVAFIVFCISIFHEKKQAEKENWKRIFKQHLSFAFVFILALSPFHFEQPEQEKVLNKALSMTFPTTFILCESAPSLFKRKNEVHGGGIDPLQLEKVLGMKAYEYFNRSLGKRPHVFVILLESISSDHVGFNGYFRSDITPNLDALSADSLIFPNTYSPSNHSNYSQTSIHSSQYPRRSYQLDTFKKINYPKTLLFDICSHFGYETAFFSAQNEDWQGMKTFIQSDSDIDHFYHALDFPEDIAFNDLKVDDAFIRTKAEAFLEKRKKQKKPLLMHLNFQRTHFPYELVSDAKKPYGIPVVDFAMSFFHYDKAKVGVVRDLYDNALRYVDEQVGHFVQKLKDLNIYDDSFIIVTADHGEAFYEQGYPTHGTTMYDDQIRTFTLMKTPKSKHKGREDIAISSIDILPSLLDLMNLKIHPNFQGKSFLERKRSQENHIFSTAQGVRHADAVIEYPWKLVKVKSEGIKLLNTSVDKSESRDLSDEYPEMQRKLEIVLNKYIISQMTYYKGIQSVRDEYYQPEY